MPDPKGRAVRLRDRVAARLGIAAVARQLSDYAAACVPTGSDEHAEPGEWITLARRVGVLYQEFKFRTVVMARESGASWDDIAYELRWRDPCGRPDGEGVERVFGEMYEAWKRGERQAWTPEDCVPAVPDAEDGVAELAGSLDDWYVKRMQGGGPLPADLHPVSDGLRLATG